MSVEQTLAILKPDAVNKKVIGKIIDSYLEKDLNIVAMRMVHMTADEARQFYYVHRERPFFNDLIDFIVSGPVVAMVLQGDNAILRHREMMGDTDPKKAASGSIRAQYADSIDANIVHGSDGSGTAKEEIAFFFKPEEIFS